MRFRTFAAVTLTMFAVPAAHALAADPSKPCVTKAFAVGDIVAATKGEAADRSKRLMKTVTQMVRPYSWDGSGGAGKIEFFDIGSSVVVTNSEDVVAEVADLIEAFRRPGTDVNKWLTPVAASSDAAPPAPLALPVPAPVCCAESWAPPTALDRMRKLAALHAETGARASYIVQLRNVAASDAASAIQKHCGEKADRCTLVVDAKSNTLLASGEPEQVRRVLDLAHALDVPKPHAQLILSALVVDVPREFLATAGLSTEKGEVAWTLSAREAHMLSGLIRSERKAGKLKVLAEPTAATQDGRSVIFRAGQDIVLANATETKVEGATTVAVHKPVSVPVGTNLTVTQQRGTNDSVALAVESEYTKVCEGLGIKVGNELRPGFTVTTVKSTAELKKGEALVVCNWSDKERVTFVVLTPTVETPACPGWFTK